MLNVSEFLGPLPQLPFFFFSHFACELFAYFQLISFLEYHVRYSQLQSTYTSDSVFQSFPILLQVHYVHNLTKKLV